LGYSLNAIKDDKYFTVHITPQEDTSYVSFESNMDDSYTCILHLIESLSPHSFDLISFNINNERSLGSYNLVDSVSDNISGYDVNFNHYIKTATKTRSATKI
jgi:S-adenosylmethionine decarboxylase